MWIIISWAAAAAIFLNITEAAEGPTGIEGSVLGSSISFHGSIFIYSSRHSGLHSALYPLRNVISMSMPVVDSPEKFGAFSASNWMQWTQQEKTLACFLCFLLMCNCVAPVQLFCKSNLASTQRGENTNFGNWNWQRTDSSLVFAIYPFWDPLEKQLIRTWLRTLNSTLQLFY